MNTWRASEYMYPSLTQAINAAVYPRGLGAHARSRHKAIAATVVVLPPVHLPAPRTRMTWRRLRDSQGEYRASSAPAEAHPLRRCRRHLFRLGRSNTQTSKWAERPVHPVRLDDLRRRPKTRERKTIHQERPIGRLEPGLEL